LEKPGALDLLLPALKAVVPGGLLAIQATRADLLNAALETCNSLADYAYVMRGYSGRTAFLFVDRKGEIRVSEGKELSNVRSAVLRIPMRTRLHFRAVGLWRRVRRKLSGMGRFLR
jgi:hypothetical protein